LVPTAENPNERLVVAERSYDPLGDSSVGPASGQNSMSVEPLGTGRNAPQQDFPEGPFPRNRHVRLLMRLVGAAVLEGEEGQTVEEDGSSGATLARNRSTVGGSD